MPVIIPKDIPAFSALQKSVFVMDTRRASSQDIRALEILIINLMPTKIQTENQLLSLLANSPLQINITFLSTQSYVGKNTPPSHLQKFYINLSDIRHKKFDGAIVTGAPVEHLSYEEVQYWDELQEILGFLRTHVTSTMYICWGAMAALYHFYAIPKIDLPHKTFGIFAHDIVCDDLLLTNLNQQVLMPHSRHSTIAQDSLQIHQNLKLLLRSDEAGVGIIRDEKDIFILGHPEYSEETLDLEYKRDVELGRNIAIPKHYYQYDEPFLSWRSDANTLFGNWLNYDVYQNTPYRL